MSNSHTRRLQVRPISGQEAATPNRIVIIGAARSGTKLLRDALAEATGAGRVPYDISYVWRYGNEERPDDVLRPDDIDVKARRFIRRYIDQYAEGQPISVIEKTVGNSLRVPAVAAVFPHAAYIHLIRDGVDVIESAMRQWCLAPDLGYLASRLRHVPMRFLPHYGVKYLRSLSARRAHHNGRMGTWGVRYPGIDDDLVNLDLLTVCARQWHHAVTHAQSAFDRSDVRVAEVRYERLVSDPAAELSRLASFAGLEIDAQKLESVQQRVVRGRVGTGHGSLSILELNAIDAEVGDALAELKYERPMPQNHLRSGT